MRDKGIREIVERYDRNVLRNQLIARERSDMAAIPLRSLSDDYTYGFRVWHSHAVIEDDTHLIRLEAEYPNGTVKAWTMTIEQADELGEQLSRAKRFAGFYVPRSER